ncbi:membrane protein [Streptomyces phage Faust]|uniref:Membrane protein n=1 Tax=Streptomyces phage Faust TaxID=2767565 RepID=A0A7G9UZ49_9CAUD|nr:membrane protein [Streptomyces phage Faust]QNN99304.1 membrane protein [Streptomyces phage Faust]
MGDDMHPASCLLWLIAIGLGIWLAVETLTN